MEFVNQYVTPSQVVTWEKGPEGFLRCRARVLRSCIMPYAKTELAGCPDESPDVVNMLVALDTMASPDSLRSLEGAQIVDWDHKWLGTDNVQELTRGNVAGKPLVDGPFLQVDLLVTNPQTIKDIEEGKIGEISAAYHAESIFEPGDWDGERYDARQTKIRYNHIAIIPSGCGRAGQDVRILNEKKKGDLNMPENTKIVKVKLRNGRYVNVDEEGAEAIAADVKEADAATETSGKKLEDLMKEAEEAKAAAESAQAELEELKGELSVYKEKLDQLLSEESIEHAAMGMVEETGEAEEILENCSIVNEKGEAIEDEKEKEKIANSIKTLHGTRLHSAVLALVGVKCENMSPEALRGAFKAQHQIVKVTGGFANRKHVAGAGLFGKKTEITNTRLTQRTAQQRLGIGTK